MPRRTGTGVAFALALAGSLLGGAAQAQEAEEIDLTPRWKAGDTLRVERLHEKLQYQGDRQVKSGKSRTPATITVVSAGEDGYILRWTWGRTELLGDLAAVAKDPVMSRMLGIMEGIPIDLRAGADGTPSEVANIDEAVALLGKVFAELDELYRSLGRSESEIAESRKAAEALTTPKLAAAIALKEPVLFLTACGSVLAPGETIEGEAEIENPLGGRAIPGRASVRLAAVDRTKGEATIEARETLDPEKARDSILEALAEAARRAGKPLPRREEMPEVVNETESRYVMDLATGWPRQATIEQRIQMGDRRRVERYSFTVAPAPAPPPK